MMADGVHCHCGHKAVVEEDCGLLVCSLLAHPLHADFFNGENIGESVAGRRTSPDLAWTGHALRRFCSSLLPPFLPLSFSP